jgi:ATP-dependent Lon protease
MENATKAFMEKNPSEDIKTIFNGEIERYSQMDENSSESTMAKTYIEELSKIPYDVKSIDIYDM